MYLAALFAPLLLSSPLVFSWGVGRPQWLLLLRWTLEQAGPAFIKWGQWGSTRPDLFPRCVCVYACVCWEGGWWTVDGGAGQGVVGQPAPGH